MLSPGVAELKLAFPPLGEQGFERHWVVNQVYHFDNSQRGAAFSSNRVYLATGDGATVSIYDVNNGERVWHKDVGYSINAVSFDSNGQYLVTGDTHYVSLWEVESGKLIWRQSNSYVVRNIYGGSSTYYRNFETLNFSPDGQYLATGDTKTDLIIWEVSSGEIIRRMDHAYDVYAVNFTPDGKYLIAGGADNKLTI